MADLARAKVADLLLCVKGKGKVRNRSAAKSQIVHLLILYNNSRILCVCLFVCVSLCVCVRVCVCVSLQPEISGTGGRIAKLLTPSGRTSPGELHKLLFDPTGRAFRENNPLEVFCKLRAEFPCTVG